MKPTGAVVAGAELAWFLLFPSLGVVQKYLGTAAAFTYFGIGLVVLITLGIRGRVAASELNSIDRRWIRLATAALFAGLVIAFIALYPPSHSQLASWLSRSGIGGGSDRDESLKLGVRELLAGRYPYYPTTRLENLVTQLPGSLVLAAPFALAGNAVWQNFFWLGAAFVVARYLLKSEQLAFGFMALTVVACPVLLQDFVTGGDLSANVIAILAGMLLMMTLVPDASVAGWKKVGVAAFAGLALSSRLNYLLLVPVLFAALARRAGLKGACVYLGVLGLAFTAVTLPFYWHDPAGFAPLYLHNKFTQFDGEVHHGGILFPSLSLLFSAIVAVHPGNRTVRGWLMQSGLVLTLPVVFLVALAIARAKAPNFLFSDYALASLFFGGMGAALTCLDQEPR